MTRNFQYFLLQILRQYTVLLWSLNDWFIILISIALALRFRQISERLVLSQSMVGHVNGINVTVIYFLLVSDKKS